MKGNLSDGHSKYSVHQRLPMLNEWQVKPTYIRGNIEKMNCKDKDSKPHISGIDTLPERIVN